MYSFEGDFRRKPVQNLGGTSRKEQRDSLLSRAHLERQKREDLRKQIDSAVKIQALVRGFLVRSFQKKVHRKLFEDLQTSLQKISNISNLETLSLLLKYMNFFYDEKLDSSKLNWLSQLLLRALPAIVQACHLPNNAWPLRLAKYMRLTLHHVVFVVRNDLETKMPLAIHFRILESATNKDTWLKHGSEPSLALFLTFLFQKGYYEDLRYIIDAKVPPMLGKTSKPPTALAASLIDMLLKPLQVYSTDISYKKMAMKAFAEAFLMKSYSEQVDYLVLPSLTALGHRFPLLDLIQSVSNEKNINPWLFHGLVLLGHNHSSLKDPKVLSQYLSVLSTHASTISQYATVSYERSEEEDDEDENDIEMAASDDEIKTVVECSIELLSEPSFVQTVVSVLDHAQMGLETLANLCQICHHLLLADKFALHHYRILYTLAFKPSILRQLWFAIQNTSQVSLFSSESKPLIQMLAKGIPMTLEDSEKLVPLLAVFCALFSHLLITLHDDEFYGELLSESSRGNIVRAMPFSIRQVIEMCNTLKDVCLGLVELAYPDSRADSNRFAPLNQSRVPKVHEERQSTQTWIHLFKVTVHLVRQLHSRDTKRPFCPTNMWISSRVSLPHDRPQISLRRGQTRPYRPFRGLMALSRTQLEDEGPPLSTREVRTLAVLREIPFVISFPDRVRAFQQLLAADKQQHQGDMTQFLQGAAISVMVRRNYLYEDAFEKLSIENEPNLKLKMRIQLVNAVGLDEAGVDGGGIFREFLTELLKTSFDPNRGFFKMTTDNLIYPNPNVNLIVEDFPKHYYFIGRILGKALYENLLVELPFADFFLSKLLGQATADIHHLASLDPVLYRNLISLRHYEGDVGDLGLDFTLVSNELGETKVEELKPNGSNIAVTSSNRIEYIHLVADYKLNRQIRLQCNAFRQGLANVVDIEWLQMFNYRELQILISGAYTAIDVEDLKRNTNYAGGYNPEHPIIQNFWRVVHSFDDKLRRKLLRYVTSCSRPPLLGFKELDPPFCIQNAGVEDRLPTASTCMNLLKLPEYKDEATLRTKLLYALESGAGFELS